MAVGVAGLAFGGVPEETGEVRTAFDVGLLGEVDIAAVRLALAGESGLEVLVRLAVPQIGHAWIPLCRRSCGVGESFSKKDSHRQGKIVLEGGP